MAAGLAIGGLLGVLFAPDKGSATRKKINDKGRKLKDTVNDAVNSAKEKLTSLKDEITEAVSCVDLDADEVPQ